jgi:hypothetical protein
MNKKQKEKGKHHEETQKPENVAKVTEQSSQKDSRRTLMAEKEHSGVYEGISRIAEKCMNPAGAKKAAAWYIDTTEKLATQALDFQAKATEWAKETPIYPLIEAQQTIGRKLVEQSVSTARSLWKL